MAARACPIPANLPSRFPTIGGSKPCPGKERSASIDITALFDRTQKASLRAMAHLESRRPLNVTMRDECYAFFDLVSQCRAADVSAAPHSRRQIAIWTRLTDQMRLHVERAEVEAVQEEKEYQKALELKAALQVAAVDRRDAKEKERRARRAGRALGDKFVSERLAHRRDQMRGLHARVHVAAPKRSEKLPITEKKQPPKTYPRNHS